MHSRGTRCRCRKDGLEVIYVLGDCAGRGPSDFGFGASPKLVDDGETALSLYQGQQAMAKIPAHDGIAFPVTWFEATLDFDGPF